MPDSAEHPSPPLRTWRPMAAWTAGILLALGLAWLVGAVVVPVWQVRSAIQRLNRATPVIKWSASKDTGSLEGAANRILEAWGNTDELITYLGERTEASRKLGIYLRMLAIIAPDKVDAIRILCYCDAPGRPVLLDNMKNSDPAVRIAAMAGIVCNGCLSQSGRRYDGTVVRIFPRGDDETRDKARMLCKELLNDHDAQVRQAAAEALKKIRGEEAKP